MLVEYEKMTPAIFRERLSELPLAYLPLGTLEWHGEHMPLGADGIQSRELFIRCAQKFGGIVLPPLWLGPDNYRHIPDGDDLIGMDNSEFTIPNRKLDGSAYWIPDGFYLSLLDKVLFNLKRAGFKAVIADGHGPSRQLWCRSMEENSRKFGMELIGISEDLYGEWRSQMDHGGLNETSLTMFYEPGLVDLKKLPEDRSIAPQGVGIDDPRDGKAKLGEQWCNESVKVVENLLRKKGLID